MRVKGSESLCVEVRKAQRCHVWVELRCTWLEPRPSGIGASSVVGHFGVHEDDFRDVTGESGGELVEADFRGVTGEPVDEPMLSCNQLKVSKSFTEMTTEAKSVQRF